MKFTLLLIAIMFLSACDERLTSKNTDQDEYTALPNLFLEETNMTLNIAKECGEEPSIAANH